MVKPLFAGSVVNQRARLPRFTLGVRNTNVWAVTPPAGTMLTDVLPAPIVATPLRVIWTLPAVYRASGPSARTPVPFVLYPYSPNPSLEYPLTPILFVSA